MRVAIVHDYIKEYGGAERVLEALHELYPNAPVFTTVYLPKFLGPHRERFQNWKIRTSAFQYVPFKEKLISPLRIIAPLIFRGWNFSLYDVVIVSQTGAYTPNIIQKSKVKSQKLICYTHTPPRYLYGYPTAREWKNNLFLRIVGELMNHVLRMVDFKASQNVDYFIANSQNVADRIQKFYRRDAKVIYPPVDTSKGLGFAASIDKRKTLNDTGIHNKNHTGYYLAGGRIARPKHIDLIIETFKELKLPVKIFGKEFAGALNIQISKYPNIQFLGEVSEEEKYQLMASAKAYIFASEDEDFGITPVEAMSLGTPVIAYRSGGVQESIIDPSTDSARASTELSRMSSLQAGSGQAATGIFFDKLTVHSLSEAIKRLNDSNHLIKRENCINHAQKFSKERFKKEIRNFILMHSNRH